ncbi:MAG: TolC family protein [Nevskia sp.]|jgi:cobalt-zinc-cadmium efflux system outer membrane protein|nr:TolC family protein [Nevskia sp.]MCK9384412.1 TolC family protein [Nevskia sp.]
MSLFRAAARVGGASLLLIAAAVLAAPEAAAAPPEPAAADSELSLHDALAATLARNPELRSFVYELKAQDGRAAQAAVRPNPELAFTAENFAGTGAVRGFTATEFTLSLSQLIELGDKRRRRLALAGAERSAIEAERATRQLDVLADVVRRYIETAADQERQTLAQRARQLAQDTLTAVEARVKAARAPLAEGSRARITFARAALDEAQAERRLRADRSQLAALWGDEEPRFTRVTADLYAQPALAPFADLAERLSRNPDLVRFVSAARVRDAELQLAIAKRAPDVQLGAGVRRLQAGNDAALVFSASIPLPFRDRNQGAIAEAQARREQVEVEQSAAALRVRTALFGLYQELLQARAESTDLSREILPQAEEALKQTEYAYQRGRYSYLEWVDAQRELLSIQQKRIDAAADAARLLAEIERLTGEPLAARAEPEASR